MKGSAQFQGQHWQLQQRWDFIKPGLGKSFGGKMETFPKKIE
jgi:hypothetical protein